MSLYQEKCNLSLADFEKSNNQYFKPMNIDNPDVKDLRKVSLDSTKSRIRFQLRFSYFRYSVFSVLLIFLFGIKKIFFSE